MASWVVFFVILVIGMVIAIKNSATSLETGRSDRSPFAIPFLMAIGMAWAVRRGGSWGVLIGIVVILLTVGFSCAVLTAYRVS